MKARTGNILSQDELDLQIAAQADKLGSYALAEIRLDADAARHEIASANPWVYDWMPASSQEMHWVKSTKDITAPFAHKGISRRAKRAKYGELQSLRAAALRDKSATSDAESVEDFCTNDAMDAVERYLVGLHLVAQLEQDPEARFTKAQMDNFLTVVREEIYNCQTDDDFLELATAAQESHQKRFDFWYTTLRDIEQKYQYLKDVS